MIIQFDTDDDGMLDPLYVQYSHLSQTKVPELSWVDENQLVAVSGASGDCLVGAHLHFEVYRQRDISVSPGVFRSTGRRVNPFSFFKWIDTSWAANMVMLKDMQLVSGRYLRVWAYAFDSSSKISMQSGNVKLWWRTSVYNPYRPDSNVQNGTAGGHNYEWRLYNASY